MSAQKRCFTCHSCGKQLECTEEEAPCEVLEGWSTISHWKGSGAVAHYTFCSLICLKSWVDASVPTVPHIFLEAFRDGESS